MPSSSEAMLFLTVKKGPWEIRIDSPHVASGSKHIHISCIKLDGEYSWNIDGTRHDRHKFPGDEKWIKKAKYLASVHLGVPESTLQLIVAEPLAHATIMIYMGTPKYGIRFLSELCGDVENLLVSILLSDSGALHIMMSEMENTQLDTPA